jgi:hypothetical protein
MPGELRAELDDVPPLIDSAPYRDLTAIHQHIALASDVTNAAALPASKKCYRMQGD